MSVLPFFNTKLRVDSNRGELVFSEDLVKFNSSFNLGNENNDLVEKEVIQKSGEFLVLLVFLDVYVVLQDTFQDELSFIIDENFFRLFKIVIANNNK